MEEKFSGRLDSISILRTIAAIGVFLCHASLIGEIPVLANSPIHFGAGISIFFAITGFLMLYTTTTQTNHFIVKKCIRFLPLYGLLTLFTYLAMCFVPSMRADGVGIVEMIKCLFFIPFTRGSISDGLVVRPLVGPAWTLYYDIYFILLFYGCMLISHKYRGLLVILVMSILVGLSFLIAPTNTIASFICSYYWVYFIIGILAYYVLKALWNKPICQLRCVRIGLLCFSILGLLLYYTYLLDYKLPLLFCLFCALLLSLRKARLNSFITKFADRSFSFFLLHYYVLIAADKLLPFHIGAWAAGLDIVVSFLFTYKLAGLCFKWIDTKFVGFLKARIG